MTNERVLGWLGEGDELNLAGTRLVWYGGGRGRGGGGGELE